MAEKAKKPRYESPVIISLNKVVIGYGLKCSNGTGNAGDCSTGSSPTGKCHAGGNAVNGDCKGGSGATGGTCASGLANA